MRSFLRSLVNIKLNVAPQTIDFSVRAVGAVAEPSIGSEETSCDASRARLVVDLESVIIAPDGLLFAFAVFRNRTTIYGIRILKQRLATKVRNK